MPWESAITLPIYSVPAVIFPTDLTPILDSTNCAFDTDNKNHKPLAVGMKILYTKFLFQETFFLQILSIACN